EPLRGDARRVAMTVSIVQLGSPRAPDEGLRIGTVRRPPRGVPKADYAARDFYDVWLPALSPSANLVAQAKSAVDSASWQGFRRCRTGRIFRWVAIARTKPAATAVCSGSCWSSGVQGSPSSHVYEG